MAAFLIAFVCGKVKHRLWLIRLEQGFPTARESQDDDP